MLKIFLSCIIGCLLLSGCSYKYEHNESISIIKSNEKMILSINEKQYEFDVSSDSDNRIVAKPIIKKIEQKIDSTNLITKKITTYVENKEVFDGDDIEISYTKNNENEMYLKINYVNYQFDETKQILNINKESNSIKLLKNNVTIIPSNKTFNVKWFNK